MNTHQLISYLADTLGCKSAQAEQMVATVVGWMTDQVTENGQLSVPGFGRFEVSKLMEYVRVDATSRKRFLVPPTLDLHFVPALLMDATDEAPKSVFTAISDALLAQGKVEKFMAEKFPVAFFKAILDAMESGERVEVPQWGSFLLTKVRVAENVYGKMSFAPDHSLSEHLNRPFSYFTEVELNDGVEFGDIATVNPYDNSREEASEEQTFLISSEPIAETTEDAEPITEITEDAEPTEDAEHIESSEPSKSSESSEPSEASESPESSDAPPSSGSRFWMYGLPIIALVIGLAALLLHLRHQEPSVSPVNAVADTLKVSKADSAAVSPAVEETPVAQAASVTDDLAAMNAQIPYGAYDIVGIDTVITVMPGQDLATISRIFLGTDIHIYLIVANDGNSNPQEGDKYKIPRLRLRK